MNKVKIEIELSYEGDVVPDEFWGLDAEGVAEAASA